MCIGVRVAGNPPTFVDAPPQVLENARRLPAQIVGYTSCHTPNRQVQDTTTWLFGDLLIWEGWPLSSRDSTAVLTAIWRRIELECVFDFRFFLARSPRGWAVDSVVTRCETM